MSPGRASRRSNGNGAPSEHDVTTSAARVRWNRTGQTSNFTLFVLNNGTPVSLGGFKTLDLRVGPDCFLEISQNFKGCINVSPTGGSENWANIRIHLQNSQNHLSRGVAPASYLAAPQTIAVSVPPDAQGPWIPRNPLGHAILRSLRIPLSAFQQTRVQSGFREVHPRRARKRQQPRRALFRRRLGYRRCLRRSGR